MLRTGFGLVLLLLPWVATAADPRDERHEQLSFLVGEWETRHRVPSRDGSELVMSGNARIEWTTGGAWLRHEFDADLLGRGPVHMTSLMSFDPARDSYNFYMFDHFGGDAGAFFGDWTDDGSLVLKAKFAESDGSTSHQKITLEEVSYREIWVSRAFSDDGENYHFESKGVYTRRP